MLTRGTSAEEAQVRFGSARSGCGCNETELTRSSITQAMWMRRRLARASVAGASCASACLRSPRAASERLNTCTCNSDLILLCRGPIPAPPDASGSGQHHPQQPSGLHYSYTAFSYPTTIPTALPSPLADFTSLPSHPHVLKRPRLSMTGRHSGSGESASVEPDDDDDQDEEDELEGEEEEDEDSSTDRSALLSTSLHNPSDALRLLAKASFLRSKEATPAPASGTGGRGQRRMGGRRTSARVVEGDWKDWPLIAEGLLDEQEAVALLRLCVFPSLDWF